MEFLKNKNLSPLNLIPFKIPFYSQTSTLPESSPPFKPGIIIDKYKIFSEYRNTFQNRFFHFLDKNLFNDTNKLLDNSSIFSDNINNNINNNINDEKRMHLLSSTNIELSALKDKKNNFLELFHNTENIFQGLKKDFETLKKRHEERLKTKVYESENKQIDKEIEKIINLMTQKVRLCEINIKEISSIPNALMSSIEIKIKDNIILNLSQKISDFSNEFRKNEQEFTEKLEKMGNKLSVIDDEDTSLKDFDKKYSNKYFYKQINNHESQINARNKSIDSLLESINELSSIFKDLQTVVQEQGTILDRIDYNIDIASDNTKNAYGHINEANKLQKQSCFRNVTLIIMFIIFIEAIMLINKYL